jgi:hypothetical protein
MEPVFVTKQFSLINSSPFYIEDIDMLGFPLAPLVSVIGYVSEGTKKIKIRTVVFVDSALEKPIMNFLGEQKGKTLELYSIYDYKEDNPKSFNCYYVELDFTSKNVEEITSVVSFLKDIDPKTSRGTSTAVYWS